MKTLEKTPIWIKVATAYSATENSLWCSANSVEALESLQKELKNQPETPERDSLLLAVANAIETHRSAVECFDRLQEAIGGFQSIVDRWG